MLTTEVVKGLLAGKVYRRNNDEKGFTEMKFGPNILKRYRDSVRWNPAILGVADFQSDWEEVPQWQEIGWKEAVDCEEKNVPLQFFSLEIGLGWIDNTKAFENCSFSFVRKHKWRKKVEVASD
jgi:hypothetical protein